jgi:hypothetical protein
MWKDSNFDCFFEELEKSTRVRCLKLLFWTAKQLVAVKGIVSKPNVKPEKVLPPTAPTMVRQFLCLMKSAGLCQGPKIMFLLTQKARWFTFRSN